MSKELIELLRFYGGLRKEAADMIEQQQKWIEELEAKNKNACDSYIQAVDLAVNEWKPKLAAAQAEVAHWKNNHETEVRRARILKERTDMPIERVQAYEKWGEDQRQLAAAQKRIELYEQALKASWPVGAVGAAFDYWNAARREDV